MKPTLTPEDFRDDADRIGCDVAAVMAVCEVESRGKGFDDEDHPKILFEAHIFHRLTKGKYDATHPHLSSVKWNRKLYGKSAAEEKKRLEEASSLDRNAALMSTSWGLFQIMGFNFALVGFKTLQQFINAMFRSENDQLAAFTEFVINNGLNDEMKDHRWEDFARHYNGPGYADNNYHVKMAKAYDKFVKQGYGPAV